MKEVPEQLCGHEFSASDVSRIQARLDEELEKFAQRRLEEEYPCLVPDARHERAREDARGEDAGCACWRSRSTGRAGGAC